MDKFWKRLPIIAFVLAWASFGINLHQWRLNHHKLPLKSSSDSLMAQGITIQPQVCPQLTLGVPYQCQFTATGGTPPYHWTSPSGLLPGLTLSDSGLLSGTVVACSGTVTMNCVSFPAKPATLTIQLADGSTISIPIKSVKKKKKS